MMEKHFYHVTPDSDNISITSSISFLICINDVDARIVDHLLKFADDTKLFGWARSQADASSLQEDLDLLSKWSSDRQMPLRSTKCTVMHLGKYHGGQQYYLGAYPMASTQKKTDLAIIHTADLKAAALCTQACLKANCILGMLARTI
jgi:Reverse transcriptase (RNA-dependent DNA polymerase)